MLKCTYKIFKNTIVKNNENPRRALKRICLIEFFLMRMCSETAMISHELRDSRFDFGANRTADYGDRLRIEYLKGVNGTRDGPAHTI